MTLIQTEPKSIKIWTTDIKRVTIRPNGTEKQIRPAWWQPWANTVAYYPLNSTDTFYDKSWNNRNLTVYQTPVYQSNYTDLTNWCFAIPNLTYSTCTVSFRCKRNWTQTWRALVDMVSSNTFIRYRYGTNWYTNFQKGLPSWSWEQSLTNDINRHLYTVTNNSSNCLVYLDETLKYTLSSFGTQTAAWSRIGTGRNGTSTNNPNIYVSEFIIEDKVRTAQEIADYYNQTKWNYWL